MGLVLVTPTVTPTKWSFQLQRSLHWALTNADMSSPTCCAPATFNSIRPASPCTGGPLKLWWTGFKWLQQLLDCFLHSFHSGKVPCASVLPYTIDCSENRAVALTNPAFSSEPKYQTFAHPFSVDCSNIDFLLEIHIKSTSVTFFSLLLPEKCSCSALCGGQLGHSP